MARGTIAAEAPRWRFPTRSFFLKLGLGTIITGLLVAAAILFTGILSPGKNTGSVTVALPTVTPTVAAKSATPAPTVAPTATPTPTPIPVQEVLGPELAETLPQSQLLRSNVDEKRETSMRVVKVDYYNKPSEYWVATMIVGVIVDVWDEDNMITLATSEGEDQTTFFVPDLTQTLSLWAVCQSQNRQVPFSSLEKGETILASAFFNATDRPQLRYIYVQRTCP